MEAQVDDDDVIGTCEICDSGVVRLKDYAERQRKPMHDGFHTACPKCGTLYGYSPETKQFSRHQPSD